MRDNPDVEFQRIPPSYWLTMADADIVLNDFDPADAEYGVLELVMDEMRIPIIAPNFWEAVGDFTTAECK